MWRGLGAGEKARLPIAVLGSVAAQEQANIVVEGSAAAQQGPHQPQDFVDLSAGREKQGASRSVVRAMAMPWLHY